jgi:hypothetical protein
MCFVDFEHCTLRAHEPTPASVAPRNSWPLGKARDTQRFKPLVGSVTAYELLLLAQSKNAVPETQGR